MKKSNGLLRQFGVVGVGTLVNMLVGFLTTPIITRLVGTTQYGQYSVFVLYASIALMVLCMGLDQALIRFYYDGDNNYQRRLLRFCWMPPIVVALVCGVVFCLLEYYEIIHFEFGIYGCVLLSITVVFQIFNRIDLVLLRVSKKTGIFSALQILYRVVFAGIAILLCFYTESDRFHILMFSTMMGYLIVSAVGILSQREIWFSKLKTTGSAVEINRKEILRYAAPYIISMGVTTIFQGIDKLSMQFFCDYSEIGIYSSALNLMHVFAILQSTFNTVWTPVSIEHYEKNPDDTEFYLRGYRIITVIMFLFGWTLIVSKDIFALLLGADFRSAAMILPCLIFNPIMLTISETTVAGIVFKKKSSIHIVIAAIACVTHIIGSFLLVPHFGGRGAAISTAIAYTVFFVLRTTLANRYYKINWELGKFSILVFVTMVYALLNTFIDSMLISIVGYIGLAGLMFLLYRNVFVEIVEIAGGFIAKLRRKGAG